MTTAFQIRKLSHHNFKEILCYTERPLLKIPRLEGISQLYSTCLTYTRPQIQFLALRGGRRKRRRRKREGRKKVEKASRHYAFKNPVTGSQGWEMIEMPKNSKV